MNQISDRNRSGSRRWLRRLAAVGIACLATGTGWAQLALNLNRQPAKPRDQKLELAMKIKDPFTLVAVGDMLQMVPIAKRADPDIQYLLNLMRKADITVANDENMIMDMDNFPGPLSHMQAPKEIADDWADMGVKMVTKANNHTWDNDEIGLWANFKELDRVGIIHVGAGRNMMEARLARYAGTPKGTVGMVGFATVSSQLNGSNTGTVVTVTPAQLAQLKAMRESIIARRNETPHPIDPPADPEGLVSVFGLKFVVGLEPPTEPSLLDRLPKPTARTAESNTLRLTTHNGVTAAQMAQLRGIANDTGTGDTLSAWGVKFRVTAGPGEYSYDINQQDERDILRDVRTGKQFSDFEVAVVHWHQNRLAFQHYSFDHYPPAFEIQVAHDVIDQGADAFVGHGVHTLKGVEIYKGKPIFYGISNFIVHQHIFASWRDAPRGGKQPPVPLTGPIVGTGELNETWWNWMEQPANFEALLTSSHYVNGQLTEVRLYPVDCGGPDRPGSQLGHPKRPSPAVAKRILEDVATYSKPFGTKISIEDGVGVIRIPANAAGGN